MLVVIEGLDRTGKSTLARELAIDFNGAVEHFSKPRDHPLDEYVAMLDGRPPSRPLIYDRGHLGELVWPKIFERHTAMDAAAFAYIELAMHAQGGVLVYCRRGLDEIIAACARDGEPIQGAQIAEAVARFDDALARSTLPRVDYRYPAPRTVARLERLAEARSRRVAPLHEITPRWVGHTRPDLLLIGEQLGPGSNGWGLPFVPYRNTSGHFLQGELTTPRLRGLKVALVNALKPDDYPEPVPELWEELRRPPAVTLGKVAADVIGDQIPHHGTAPHPQYVRRFKRAEGPGYLASIIADGMRRDGAQCNL